MGPLFTLNQEKAAQAFLKQVDLLKDMDKLVRQQIMLVEAANTAPYGWKVANDLEPEIGTFSEQDKSHTKALREAEGFVRRDNKEFNARKKDFKKRGGTKWLSGRGSFPCKRGCYASHPLLRSNVLAFKNNGFPAQQGVAKCNNLGALPACFKCGDTGHLIA